MISIGAPSILSPNSAAAMRAAVTGLMQLPVQYWPEKSSRTAILILLSEICAAAGSARIASPSTTSVAANRMARSSSIFTSPL